MLFISCYVLLVRNGHPSALCGENNTFFFQEDCTCLCIRANFRFRTAPGCFLPNQGICSLIGPGHLFPDWPRAFVPWLAQGKSIVRVNHMCVKCDIAHCSGRNCTSLYNSETLPHNTFKLYLYTPWYPLSHVVDRLNARPLTSRDIPQIFTLICIESRSYL